MEGKAGGSSRLPYGSYIVWVATKAFDVGLEPLKGEDLIIESKS